MKFLEPRVLIVQKNELEKREVQLAMIKASFVFLEDNGTLLGLIKERNRILK